MQQIRRSRNLTQEQVAELIGMDRVSIGYIEQGRRAPKLSTLFSLANVYDVEMQDFFSLPAKSQDSTHE
jgi:transcriptional regulator with XRE-family HTH domain